MKILNNKLTSIMTCECVINFSNNTILGNLLNAYMYPQGLHITFFIFVFECTNSKYGYNFLCKK